MNDGTGLDLNLAADGRAAACEIAGVRAHVLRAQNDVADVDGATETLLVEIQDAAGRVGIGEADTASSVAQALVLMDDVHFWCRGMRSTLLGRDPVQIGAIWDAARRSDVPRRPVGRRAARAGGCRHRPARPGGQPARQARVPPARRSAARPHITPYATVLPGAGRRAHASHEMVEATCELLDHARRLGFRAAKMEVLYAGVARDRDIVDSIREGRRVVGDDMDLLIDFGYRWRDWRDALWTLRQVEDCRIYPRRGDAAARRSPEPCQARSAGSRRASAEASSPRRGGSASRGSTSVRSTSCSPTSPGRAG